MCYYLLHGSPEDFSLRYPRRMNESVSLRDAMPLVITETRTLLSCAGLPAARACFANPIQPDRSLT